MLECAETVALWSTVLEVQQKDLVGLFFVVLIYFCKHRQDPEGFHMENFMCKVTEHEHVAHGVQYCTLYLHVNSIWQWG